MFNYQTVENFKFVRTYLTVQETPLKIMNVFDSLAKNLEIFFKKTLWLYNLLPIALVWVVEQYVFFFFRFLE